MNATRDTLLALLDGTTFANVIMSWGKPGPIRLPDDPDARARLVDAHIAGGPADVCYSPNGRAPEMMRVAALSLAGFTPDATGRAHWVAVDLDSADGHGPSGLVDPSAAMKCVASAADAAGLFAGVLAARSRGGRGRHVWLLLPTPVSLDDAVFGVAALGARAFNLATRDTKDYNCPHAFRRADGSLTMPGDPGGFELFPIANERPAIGWALALPSAGAFRESGGGVVIDAYGNQPYELDTVPRCDAAHWSRFVAEARTAHRPKRQPKPQHAPVRYENRDQLERIDHRTRQFIDGRVMPGARNAACFSATCNMFAVGIDEGNAERLILEGAASCGLPEREARAAFRSALTAMRRKGVVA